jgi:hypothetical protein
MPGPITAQIPFRLLVLTRTPLGARDEQRQERAGAVVDAPPVDGEHTLPLVAVIFDETAAAADAGVIEDQVDVVADVLFEHLIAKPQDLRLVGHIAGMAGDQHARRRIRPCHHRGLLDRLRVEVAGRDRATLRGELADELPAHARRAAGDHRELPGEGADRAVRGPFVCYGELDPSASRSSSDPNGQGAGRNRRVQSGGRVPEGAPRSTQATLSPA